MDQYNQSVNSARFKFHFNWMLVSLPNQTNVRMRGQKSSIPDLQWSYIRPFTHIICNAVRRAVSVWKKILFQKFDFAKKFRLYPTPLPYQTQPFLTTKTKSNPSRTMPGFEPGVLQTTFRPRPWWPNPPPLRPKSWCPNPPLWRKNVKLTGGRKLVGAPLVWAPLYQTCIFTLYYI